MLCKYEFVIIVNIPKFVVSEKLKAYTIATMIKWLKQIRDYKCNVTEILEKILQATQGLQRKSEGGA